MRSYTKSISRLLALTAIAGVLAACGGGGGSGSAAPVSLTGTAAKGILRGAQVKAYEVINGVQGTTALATATTNSNGEYTLSVPATSNPVIVEVKAITGTKMLDETQVDANGDFQEVNAPADLNMRSFVSSAQEAATIRINPLTEAALQIAAQTLDANGKAVGLKADVLLAAREVVRTQLAPEGVNPFIEAPPVKLAGASDEQKKLVAFMAGLMTETNGDRKSDTALNTKIQEIAKGVQLSVGTDGKPTGVSKEAAVVLNTFRENSFKAAAAAKDPELKSTIATTVTALVTQATAATATTQASTAGVTVNVSELSASEGFNGFIQALRTGFQASQKILDAANESLKKTYVDGTLKAADYVDMALNSATKDCRVNSTTGLFACKKSTGSPMAWTLSGSTYSGVGTLADGRYVESTVTPSGTATNGSATLASKIWLDSKKSKQVGEIKNMVFSGSVTGTGAAAVGTATVSGIIDVIDDKTDLKMTLTAKNLQVSGNDDGLKITGDVTLAVSNGDTLTGDLSMTEKSFTRTYTAYGNTYQWQDNYTTALTANLKASNKDAQVASLAIVAERTAPKDPAAAVTEQNWGPTKTSIDLALANATSALKMVQTNAEWATVVQTLTIKTASEEVVLTGDFKVATPAKDGWCEYMDDVRRCASSLTLTTKGGTYTATITKTNGNPNGDIKKGDVVVGKIKNGNIEINGTLVSLY